MNLEERAALAATITGLSNVAARVTSAFYARHPAWDARFGAAGRARCLEDTRFHLSFLAGAVLTGRTAPFVDYARWAAGMLAARRIDTAHLIEHLEILADVLTEEMTASHAQCVCAPLAEARRALAEVLDAGGARGAEPPPPPLEVAYLKAALAGRRAEAFTLASEALRSGFTLRRLYEEVLIETQRKVGDRWASASISVAEEHMASAVTGSVMARLYDRMPTHEPSRGRAIMAGVEGELHALPAQFAADLWELDGWDVSFVGTNVPTAAILAVVDEQKPDILGLSVTMPFNLPRTVEAIRALRERAPTLRILIGGRAVQRETELAGELRVELAVPSEPTRG